MLDTNQEDEFLYEIFVLILDKNEAHDHLDAKISELNERIIIGGENEIKSSPTNNRMFNEIAQRFSGKTREVSL